MPFFLFQNSSDIDSDQSNLNSEQSASESIADLHISLVRTIRSLLFLGWRIRKWSALVPVRRPLFGSASSSTSSSKNSGQPQSIQYILTHHALSSVHSTSLFAGLFNVFLSTGTSPSQRQAWQTVWILLQLSSLWCKLPPWDRWRFKEG